MKLYKISAIHKTCYLRCEMKMGEWEMLVPRHEYQEVRLEMKMGKCEKERMREGEKEKGD